MKEYRIAIFLGGVETVSSRVDQAIFKLIILSSQLILYFVLTHALMSASGISKLIPFWKNCSKVIKWPI